MNELVFFTITYFVSVVLMYFLIRYVYSKGSSKYSKSGATVGDFILMLFPLINTMALLGCGIYEAWEYIFKTKKFKFNFNKFFGIRRD